MCGLERLEYRGYDSAGLALQENGRIESLRAVGNLSALREAVATRTLQRAQTRNGGKHGRRAAVAGLGSLERARRHGLSQR